MATIDVFCPFCQTGLSFSPASGGKVVRCSACHSQFQVPVPVAASAYGNGGMERPEVREFANRKIAAGICAILMGGLGIHKFILGLNSAGVIMLVTTIVCSIGSIVVVPILGVFAIYVIGVVEGIIYLTKSDADFYQEYAVRKKQWF